MVRGKRSSPEDALSAKSVVIVVSAGRTGTRFLGDLLCGVIEDAFSVHEPDTLIPSISDTWRKVRRFGWYHMLAGRLLGRTGIRNLSQRYLSGRLSPEALVQEIRRHRAAYYASVPQSLIVESHYQWFGILPAVPRAFARYRIVAIVRDPRTWVTSILNTGRHYGQHDIVTRLGLRRLEPRMVGDAALTGRWGRMSAFERNCWHWRFIYERITRHVSGDPHARLFRYEDLFLSQRAEQEFAAMLEFMTDFAGPRRRTRWNGALLDQRRNASVRRFDDWRSWDRGMVRSLHAICGPLMRRFEYGAEEPWREMLS